MRDRPLACPGCDQALSAAKLVAACSTYWAPQGWIGFDCPACGAFFHVQARAGAVVFGEIDGAPGPCFMPLRRCAVPGLRVSKTAGWVDLSAGSKRKRISAKD